jgi:hypothetical protein
MGHEKTKGQRRLIVNLVCSPSNRGILDRTVEHVSDKAKKQQVECKRIEFSTSRKPRQEEVEALGELISWLGSGRLYIVGHGDWQNQKVGSWTANMVAQLMAREGASYQLVSLTGCRTGRDRLDSANPRQEGPIGVYLANSMDSFASVFHNKLKEYGVVTEVYARVWGTQANMKPTVLTMTDDINHLKLEADRAFLFQLAGEVSNKKLRFYWEDEVQRREWVLIGSKSDKPDNSDGLD